MEEKFESILANYLNGNRKDALNAYKGLSSNEQYNFSGWITNQYYDSPIPDEYFKMVLFFLTQS